MSVPMRPDTEPIRPDEIIPPAPAGLGPDADDWDDEWDEDTLLGDLRAAERAHGQAITAVGELVDHMRDAAARLDELDDPAAREVGRWLRSRAQEATVRAHRL